ncbi:MAG: diacylglycerol/lipid kinase family protein [Acidimicrobiales bacterium]
MSAEPPLGVGGSTSTAARGRQGAPPLGSRITAGGALAVSVATLALLAFFTATNLLYVLGSLLAAGLGISALWIAATNRRFRYWAATAAALLVGGAIAVLIVDRRGIVAVAVALVGIVIAWVLGTAALRWEVRRALADRWHRVPAVTHGVVLMNPRSGGGKVVRLKLADEARRRGIEAILLESGDDLRLLAETAVARGADALGMAGGDGSQAVVASVAAGHGLPFVCIPAGTRNHFALDLGIDRADPLGALGAFGSALETAIDLGEINGEVFVNNVSLGIYARVVASEEYREAKRRTVAEMLPDLLGPEAAPSGLVVRGPDGPIVDAQVIQVSNNPYTLSSVSGFGSRPRLDSGSLGVATLSIDRPGDVNRLVALEVAGHPERFPGWRQWTASALDVTGPSPMAAASDGEAQVWAPPLHFAIRPAALRVRIAAGQVGASPAFLLAPVGGSTLVGLGRVLRGRPSGIVGAAGTEDADRPPSVSPSC